MAGNWLKILKANQAEIISYIDTEVQEILDELQDGTYGLSAIKTAVDTVDTVVDGIASDIGTLVNTGGTATLGAIIGDVANIDIATRLTTIDTVVDGIQTDLDNPTDGLGAIKTAVDGIDTKIGTPVNTGGTATISAILGDAANVDVITRLSAIDSSISGLQNNTDTYVSSHGQIFVIPDTGNEYTKIYVNTFVNGTLNDVDSDNVSVTLTQADGTDVTSRLYQDGDGTDTALATIVGGTFNGDKKLVKDSTGRYFAFYKAQNTDSEEVLNLQIQYEESSALKGRDSNLTIRGNLPSDVATLANQTAMQGAGFVTGTDSLEAISNAIAALNDESAADVADAVWDESLAAHSTVGSTGKALADIETDVTQLLTDVATIDGFHDVPTADSATNTQMRDVIGNKTDTTGGNSIVSLIKTVDGVVDEIPSETNSKTFNATALASINSEVDTALTDINLDHLAAVATGSADMTAEVVDGSIISRILSATSDTSTYDPSTDSLEAIRNAVDAITGGGSGLNFQAPLNITASVTTTETTLFDKRTAGHVYVLEHLRLKTAANPNPNTLTINLYEEVNGTEIKVDEFIIDEDNYDHAHSLMDMFGLDNIQGEIISVKGQMDAGSVTVNGQANFSDTTL